ncbi:MAG: NADPH-dependent oxidoreductase [Pedobacter sp.]|nr:MAG: NADPH-dependent oxidoreductase [Pedobacter sp.]
MITILSGTNRPHSYTLKLAEYYLSEFRKSGHPVNLINLEDLPSELSSPQAYRHKPTTFIALQQLIQDTEKFVFIVPEYNGSFPGVLKTLIDHCEYPASFYNKKACLVGLSAGKYGNIRGIEHFSGVCAYLHLNVLPLRLHIPLIKSEFDTQGQLNNPETVGFVKDQIQKFLAF